MLGPEGVLDGHLDVVERDVGSSGRLAVPRRHLRGLDSLLSGDKNYSQASLGLAADGKVVGKRSASNPPEFRASEVYSFGQRDC